MKFVAVSASSTGSISHKLTMPRSRWSHVTLPLSEIQTSVFLIHLKNSWLSQWQYRGLWDRSRTSFRCAARLSKSAVTWCGKSWNSLRLKSRYSSLVSLVRSGRVSAEAEDPDRLRSRRFGRLKIFLWHLLKSFNPRCITSKCGRSFQKAEKWQE